MKELQGIQETTQHFINMRGLQWSWLVDAVAAVRIFSLCIGHRHVCRGHSCVTKSLTDSLQWTKMTKAASWQPLQKLRQLPVRGHNCHVGAVIMNYN